MLEKPSFCPTRFYVLMWVSGKQILGSGYAHHSKMGRYGKINALLFIPQDVDMGWYRWLSSCKPHLAWFCIETDPGSSRFSKWSIPSLWCYQSLATLCAKFTFKCQSDYLYSCQLGAKISDGFLLLDVSSLAYAHLDCKFSNRSPCDGASLLAERSRPDLGIFCIYQPILYVLISRHDPKLITGQRIGHGLRNRIQETIITGELCCNRSDFNEITVLNL